jgi:threonyl-tRNA synthetase
LIAVGDKHKNYTQKVSNLLEKYEIRASTDLRNETVGKKIREAEKSKIPFMGIIGDKEVNNQTISIRGKGGEDVGEMDIDKLINFIREEELKSYN